MNTGQTLHQNFRVKNKPLKVLLKRGEIIESIHSAHAVVSDNKGRVLMFAGNPYYESFIRSALKPFQALPFVNSCTVEHTKSDDKSLAIACGSHKGTTEHAREAFKILWNSDIDLSALKCPIPNQKQSPLEHNCSGKHAAFLATCKKMNWPLESYLKINHPIQKEIFRRISEIISIPNDELVIARDDCGAPTLLLPLNKMATLYAKLSSSVQPQLEQINRSMVQNPNLIAGKGHFDTELMERSHCQIVSKGGSEGIQCIGRNGEGLGLAIKVEDGAKRAKHAVAIHLLKQLDWVTPTGLNELSQNILSLKPDVSLEVKGELKFQEN